jgi:tripartite-type tricarboxylate transporter receptor subunit TctC
MYLLNKLSSKNNRAMLAITLLGAGIFTTNSFAQTPAVAACPEKNILYWQAFPPGGESDISARHQQTVLKRRCPSIDTVIQYKAGAGGGLLWSQLNTLPADGLNIAGINLPHIVLQPMEGQVQYKTADLTPVYWYHYTPDALVVPTASPWKNFQEFLAAVRAKPDRFNLGGSGLNSANHAAHERLNAEFKIKTQYVPFKGTGDMQVALFGGHVDAGMSYTSLVMNHRDKVRVLAVAMDKRHPSFPDVPTFKELGVNWIDGAYRGVAMPKSSTPEQRKRVSDLMRALNDEAEMKALALRSGFELVNVGIEQMDSFMADRTKVYTDVGNKMGLGKK